MTFFMEVSCSFSSYTSQMHLSKRSIFIVFFQHNSHIHTAACQLTCSMHVGHDYEVFEVTL